MSVYITPITFEAHHISPDTEGSGWAACTTDGISSGCKMSRSGSTLTLGTGKLIACGRQSSVDEEKTFALGSTGYARLILTIDKSKSDAQKVALDLETANTMAAFPALTKNDINNGGVKYQMVLCLLDLAGAGITWKCGRAHSKGYGVQVLLPVSGWSNNQQTVYVDGLLADSPAIVTFDPASQGVWDAAGIIPFAQGEGTITFRCTTVPTAAVTANILLY